ncbi:glycosyltransferase [Culicoidibacter larvae]|uniref:Glycosyltransferase n=1 Tax=Culicoidibacter larvae TaxID=2579976 RepID=A0A5R8QE38_9FIRM|nr:glycosyltransferase [Culicoidibacter larvae]TLG75236.1 glycosyltransferase [Culicoidibacter larvae]
MKSKKIVFIMRNINLLGGIEKITIHYINGLLEAGYNVDVINLFDEGNNNTVVDSRVTVHNIAALNKIVAPKSIGRKLFDFYDLTKKMQRKIALLYKNSDNIFVATNPTYGMYIPKRWRKNTIIQLHDSVVRAKKDFKLTFLFLKYFKKQYKNIVFFDKRKFKIGSARRNSN